MATIHGDGQPSKYPKLEPIKSRVPACLILQNGLMNLVKRTFQSYKFRTVPASLVMHTQQVYRIFLADSQARHGEQYSETVLIISP